MKHSIKHRVMGKILFEKDCDTFRLCVEAAIDSNVDLRDAYLRGADLSSADLSCADLRDADLSSADLRDAYLRSACLISADLSSADLRGAKGILPETCTPLLMLLDQPGKIRAYKLVNENGEGPVQGGVFYEIGKTVEAESDTDVSVHCGAGINLATLDWCLKKYLPGYRVLICEFTSKDIAAIPTGTDGKFRVHRCKVVAEKDIAGMLSGGAKA